MSVRQLAEINAEYTSACAQLGDLLLQRERVEAQMQRLRVRAAELNAEAAALPAPAPTAPEVAS